MTVQYNAHQTAELCDERLPIGRPDFHAVDFISKQGDRRSGYLWQGPNIYRVPGDLRDQRHTRGQGRRVRRAVNDLLNEPDSRFPKRECAPALVRYWRHKMDTNHRSHGGQRRSIRILRHAAYYYDKARHLDFSAQHYVELQARGGWGVLELMPGPGKGGALRTFTRSDAYRYERKG